MRTEAGTLAGVEVKLDELTALVRELPGKLALASSSDGRLSQQWNRPRTTNGGYQVSADPGLCCVACGGIHSCSHQCFKVMYC
jgi:hypothetical protein